MRRWLTLLLLVVLPLQFSWAAAAAYCGHESSSQAAQAGHVGHHEHEHQAAPDVAKTQSNASDLKQPGGDNDCGYCHLSAAKPVPMQVSALPALAGPVAEDTSVHPLQTREPDHHERPNWCLA